MDSRLAYTTVPDYRGPIEELSCVTLKDDFEEPEVGTILSGSVGTVVTVFGEGEAFDVEFDEPQAIVTLVADQIAAIPEASRERIIADAVQVRS